MGRTKQTARPSQPLVKKKPEDQMNTALNNLYLTGRPAAVRDYKPRGGRTGSR